MNNLLFITGTDTNAGKTHVAVHLLKKFKSEGYSTLGIKPVSAGCEWMDNEWKNEDALQLQQNSTVQLPYAQINPIALEAAGAPHLMADKIKLMLSVDEIVKKLKPALQTNADKILIEGAGGWLVPLNNQETMADLAVALKADIILVVGMRLGCLNHALLTYESIVQKGCRIQGWIANCLDPDMNFLSENIATLAKLIKTPLLEIIPKI